MQLIVCQLLYLSKAVQKFIWRYKETRIANTRMQQINNVDGPAPLDFKNGHNATVIISAWYWRVVRQTDNVTEYRVQKQIHTYMAN